MNKRHSILSVLAALWAVSAHAASVVIEGPPKKTAEMNIRAQVNARHTKYVDPKKTGLTLKAYIRITNRVNVAKSFLMAIGSGVNAAVMALIGGNPQMATAGANFGLGCQSGRNNGKGKLARRESRYTLNRAAGTFSLKTSRRAVDGNNPVSASAGHGLRVHTASHGTVMSGAGTFNANAVSMSS